MFHMVFVQITEFDWLSGRQTGLFLEKMLKNFPETIRWMKLLLFIHAYGIILYINFVFCFSQVRTLVAMATFFTVVVLPGQ